MHEEDTDVYIMRFEAYHKQNKSHTYGLKQLTPANAEDKSLI